MCTNRLGLIVFKRFCKIVVSLIYGKGVIPCSKECFKPQFKQRLLDQFRQKWEAEIQQSSKCLNYRIFKSNRKIERYLTKLTYNNRLLFARFRCRNHNLPVVTGCCRGIQRPTVICAARRIWRCGGHLKKIFCFCHVYNLLNVYKIYNNGIKLSCLCLSWSFITEFVQLFTIFKRIGYFLGNLGSLF